MKALKIHHLLTLFAVFVLTLAVAVVPPQVQAASNPFESFTQSIAQRWSALMLKLPGNKSGREVLNQSMVAAQKITSADVSWQAKADMLNESNTSVGTFSFSMGGPATFNSFVTGDNYMQQATFSFEATAEKMNTKTTGEMFIKPDAFYAKITELPDFGELLPPEVLSNILNQWVYFPADPSMTVKQETTNPELTKKMTAAADKLMKAATIGQAKREKLDGKGVFVVEAIIPDDAMLAYIEEVEAATMEQNKTTPAQKQGTMNSVKGFLDGTSEFKAIMYIDDSNFYMRKMEMPLQFDFKAMMSEAEANELDLKTVGLSENPTRMKFDIVVNMSKFNEKFNLQAPTEFVPFTELMSTMMPAAAMGAPSGAAVSPKKMPARPAELPELSAEEKEMLKQYGLEVEDLY